ncbi:MAG: response regulator [Planctomycetales bacterium]|nr:response regulator [Planctomycetales bacterium]
MNGTILLVDDDPNVLSGFKRHLRKQFDVELAEGGQQALELVRSGRSFAVVVSDMQMPEVNGLQVLAAVADAQPDTVRIMLTGNADQKTAVDAVNQGHIFRFLNKPCSPETLTKTLEAGLRQYQLVRAEQDLLSNTLRGTVSLVTEVLSLVHPEAFGRAARVRSLCRRVCQALQVPNAWEVEIAAMLSQIGCVSVPQETWEKLFAGKQLSAEERRMVDTHPEVGASLVRKVPRLETVADMIARQNVREKRHGRETGERLEIGEAVFRAVLDFDSLAAESSPNDALRTVTRNSAAWCDAGVLEALAALVEAGFVTKSLVVDELAPGMIFDEDVRTVDGGILVAKGQEVNESMLSRLRNFAQSAKGVRQPIGVRCYVCWDDQDPTELETSASVQEKSTVANL